MARLYRPHIFHPVAVAAAVAKALAERDAAKEKETAKKPGRPAKETKE